MSEFEFDDNAPPNVLVSAKLIRKQPEPTPYHVKVEGKGLEEETVKFRDLKTAEAFKRKLVEIKN